MAVYLGARAPSSTVRVGFTLHDQNGARADISASLEEADFSVFKDGALMTLSATTIAVTANPTPTHAGSGTGAYLVAVDMSKDTEFTSGSEYALLFHPSDETVDGFAPAAWLAYWVCQRDVFVSGTFDATGATSTASDLDTAAGPSYDITGWALYRPDTEEIVTITAYNTGTQVATHEAWPSSTTVSTGEDWVLIPQTKASLDWTNGERLDTIIDSILVDTAQIGTAAGADIAADIAAVKSDTGTIATAVDTTTEGTGVPAANAVMAAKVEFLFQALRNKRTSTASQDDIYNDAGTSIAAATLSDNGTTFTRNEYA